MKKWHTSKGNGKDFIKAVKMRRKGYGPRLISQKLGIPRSIAQTYVMTGIKAGIIFPKIRENLYALALDRLHAQHPEFFKTSKRKYVKRARSRKQSSTGSGYKRTRLSSASTAQGSRSAGRETSELTRIPA